jgi:two-component system cell cycle sensor histidine kinase/response regulator CckA
VYGIVKQTNGYVFVDSVVGEGTTFRIFLPRHIPVAGELTEPAQPDKAAQAKGADLTGRGTILLVEDEEGLRGLNARGLTSRGYTVLEAGNGVEAIEVIEQRGGDVDLVVSDVVMPEMDGPTLATRLREINPGLKIIFVSGYAEDAFDKNLPDDVKFNFLPKPFTLKQLVAAVKDTMAA